MDVYQDNDIRALMGSLSIIGIMLCVLCVCYKYAVCQDNENRRREWSSKPVRVIYVNPDERVSLQVYRSNKMIV